VTSKDTPKQATLIGTQLSLTSCTPIPKFLTVARKNCFVVSKVARAGTAEREERLRIGNDEARLLVVCLSGNEESRDVLPVGVNPHATGCRKSAKMVSSSRKPQPRGLLVVADMDDTLRKN